MRHVLQCLVVAMVVGVLATGCQTMTGETAGQNVTDTGITTAVKSKLAGDRMGTLGRVSVKTVRETVYLTGVVPTAAEKARAERLAKEVDGVKKVQNNLQVDTSQNR
ncbi:MAG: BON domain-containing protein [Nitrospirae bacterium]|nr:MAG: BON domain-containing protein [Nitrospirota bacterium]